MPKKKIAKRYFLRLLKTYQFQPTSYMQMSQKRYAIFAILQKWTRFDWQVAVGRLGGGREIFGNFLIQYTTILLKYFRRFADR